MSAPRRIPPFAVFLSILTTCALVAATAGCSSPTEVEVLLDRIDRAEARWLETRPLTYEAESTRTCECLQSDAGPVLLEISLMEGMLSSSSLDPDEEIVEAVYLGGPDDGEAVPEEILQNFYTAEGLFDLVRRAVDEDAHSISVETDPERGYLRQVNINWDAQVADEETIIRFEVLTPAS